MSRIRRFTKSIIVALFVILVSVVFFQVVSRYVFNRPPAWTEELARYCQVWIILLTAPICIRKGSHLAVDYFSHMLSPTARFRMDILISLLILLYVTVVTVFGVRLMMVGRFQISPALGINMSVIYAVLPLAGSLMILETVIRTLNMIKEKRVHQ
jgi:TRAP-type C4-dicarboxylate transport system permease small subunit